MTDHVTSALRQEGPQQEQQHDIRLMTDYQIVEVLKARAAHDANDEFGRWLGRLLTAWVTDSPLADIDVILSERAALSASRTAQAPQQEGVDLVARLIDYRGQVLNGFRHISRFEEAELIQAAIDGLRHQHEQDLRSRFIDTFTELAANQCALDPAAAKVLYDNLWSLYDDSDPDGFNPQPPAPVAPAEGEQ